MTEFWCKTRDGKEVVRVRDAGPGVDGAYLWPSAARILLKDTVPCDPVPGMLA